jgi:hypothetical protein
MECEDVGEHAGKWLAGGGAGWHLEVAGHGSDTAFELALGNVTDMGRRQERGSVSVTGPGSGDGRESGGVATPVLRGIAPPCWRRGALSHCAGRALGIGSRRWRSGILDCSATMGYDS